MTHDPHGWTALVLAGQRPGIDPVAAHFGLEAKALVPVAGEVMLGRVLMALADTPQVARIIVLAQNAPELLRHPDLAWAAAEPRITARVSGRTISGSVLSAIDDPAIGLPVLVTTADNVMLTPATVAEFVAGAGASDVSVAFVERGNLEAAVGPTRRTWLAFRDGAFTGANLFALTGAGSFIKEGTGDVVMTQTSTYTGGTEIAAGTVRADASKALGTGAAYVAGGTLLTNTSAALELPGGLTQTATGTLALQLGAADAGTLSTAGVVTLAGPLAVTFRPGFTPKAGDTLTLPLPSKPALAVKVAVNTNGSAVAVKPLTMPPVALMSPSVKPTGASLKVKVTLETLSATLRLLSTMLTVTLGLLVSTL